MNKLAALTALGIVVLFAALTVSDVATIIRYQTGPERQMAESAIGHLWNARRTLNLTLSGQEWILAGEAIESLNGNPQCAYKGPFDVCKPDFDWDSMSASFMSTGDELIKLDAESNDSFTKAQALQNNQKYIDEAVEHVREAGGYEYGFKNWNALVAGAAWVGALGATLIVVALALGARRLEDEREEERAEDESGPGE